jgi:hypothetical protein
MSASIQITLRIDPETHAKLKERAQHFHQEFARSLAIILRDYAAGRYYMIPYGPQDGLDLDGIRLGSERAIARAKDRVRDDALDFIGACFGENVGPDKEAFGSDVIRHNVAIDLDIELTPYSKAENAEAERRERADSAMAAQLAQLIAKRKAK